MYGCSDDSESNEPCPSQPTLTTNVAQATTSPGELASNAVLSGEIINTPLGPNCEVISITNQGFVYSLQTQPTVDDNLINVSGQNINYTITNLPIGITYYVRTYLTNPLGTYYGNEVSFETPEPENPVYMDDNGFTVKAQDWAEVGMSGELNGIIYTVVDNETIREINGNVCTSLVTDMSELFMNTSINESIKTFDVSNVTTMQGMFLDSPSSTGQGPDANDNWFLYWDVSSVTDMSEMFLGTNFFYFYNNSSELILNLSSWDTSNVTSMSQMFSGTEIANIGINNWDVSSVTDMSQMFYYANNQHLINYSEFNLDNWDVSSVTDMSQMFEGIGFLGSSLSSWDVSNVTDMSSMFVPQLYSNEYFSNLSINNWDVSNVTNMGSMFSGSEFNNDITSWDVSNVTMMGNMFSNTPFNQPIGNWDVSNVTWMSQMFSFYTNLGNSNTVSEDVQAGQFNQDISGWNVSSVTFMSGMFSNNLAFNQNISSWDVSNVTHMTAMFFVNGQWNYPIPFNQNLSNWNVSNVTHCDSFSEMRVGWSLPQPNFTNCTP